MVKKNKRFFKVNPKQYTQRKKNGRTIKIKKEFVKNGKIK